MFARLGDNRRRQRGDCHRFVGAIFRNAQLHWLGRLGRRWRKCERRSLNLARARQIAVLVDVGIYHHVYVAVVVVLIGVIHCCRRHRIVQVQRLRDHMARGAAGRVYVQLLTRARRRAHLVAAHVTQRSTHAMIADARAARAHVLCASCTLSSGVTGVRVSASHTGQESGGRATRSEWPLGVDGLVEHDLASGLHAVLGLYGLVGGDRVAMRPVGHVVLEVARRAHRRVVVVVVVVVAVVAALLGRRRRDDAVVVVVVVVAAVVGVVCDACASGRRLVAADYVGEDAAARVVVALCELFEKGLVGYERVACLGAARARRELDEAALARVPHLGPRRHVEQLLKLGQLLAPEHEQQAVVGQNAQTQVE